MNTDLAGYKSRQPTCPETRQDLDVSRRTDKPRHAPGDAAPCDQPARFAFSDPNGRVRLRQTFKTKMEHLSCRTHKSLIKIKKPGPRPRQRFGPSHFWTAPVREIETCWALGAAKDFVCAVGASVWTAEPCSRKSAMAPAKDRTLTDRRQEMNH